MIFDDYNYSYSFEDDAHVYKVACNASSGNVFLDFKFLDRKSKVLVVCFSGAYPHAKDKELPFYTGIGLSKKINNVSFLFIGDPALYLEGVSLGWYSGVKGFNLQKILPGFIDFFIQKSGCERVIFFGGSGGGFASLYYSRYVDNSLAIVWNPQTNIQLYDVLNWKVIDTYSKSAFGAERNALSEYIDTDLACIYSSRRFPNKVIYLQNLTDRHVLRDLKPFMKAVFNFYSDYSFACSVRMSSDFYLHLTDWSKNHRPPPREVLYYLLERLSRPESEWPNNLSNILSKAEKIGSKIKVDK